MDELEIMGRVLGIIMGSTVTVTQLQGMGLTITDAKIALRASLFMLEDIYRGAKTPEQLEKRANELSPEVYKFIKSEIELASQ